VCTNSACPGSCTLDSQCAPGNYCDSPECFPKKDDGEGCSKANECTSNFCADGVCCNSACGGSDRQLHAADEHVSRGFGHLRSRGDLQRQLDGVPRRLDEVGLDVVPRGILHERRRDCARQLPGRQRQAVSDHGAE
jgi:hypothetical protein